MTLYSAGFDAQSDAQAGKILVDGFGHNARKGAENRPLASTISGCREFVISRSPVQVGSPAPRKLNKIKHLYR